MTALALTACASTDGTAPTGPRVTATETGPTGHLVTFTYEDDAATAVGLVGDLFFTDPSALTPTMAHESKPGDAWEPGDVAAPQLWGPPLPMVEVADGLWELTMAVPAGLYSYGFVTGECAVAAVCPSVPDPQNPPVLADSTSASRQFLSQLYVPASEAFPTYDVEALAPVAAGEKGQVTSVTYTYDGEERHLGLYLPAGFEPEREDGYPVLVLSHGVGGNETSWFSEGAAARIVDQAIAQGRMPATVVATTDFYGLGQDVGSEAFFRAYRDELVGAVLPLLESEYHVSTSPEERAFAGLSMGGAIALDIAAHGSGEFGYVAAWSAAADLEAGAVALPTPAEQDALEELSSLSLGTGLQDDLESIADLSVERSRLYREAGLPVTEFNVDGGHTWQVWQDLLTQFAMSTVFR